MSTSTDTTIATKKTPIPSTGRFLKAEEVAAELNVSVRQIWAMVSAGTLTPIRHGPRCTRFPRAAIEEYLASLTK